MKNKIIWVFWVVFSLIFTFVLLSIFIDSHNCKSFWLITLAPVFIAGLIAIYKLLERHKDFLEKHYVKILWIFLAAMFISEFVFALVLRVDPQWDIGAVQKGAAEWAETGTFKNYYSYYYRYSNNLGAMTFLHIFLKIGSIFGIKDYYAVGAFANSALLCLAMALVSLTCRALSDTKHAVFALVLFALSPQYWFMGGMAYSDSLSTFIPILAFYIYAVHIKSENCTQKKKILMWLLIGFVTALGAKIKFPAVIMTIAIIIGMCLEGKPKELLKAVTCIGVVVAVATVSFNAYIYSSHLDKDTMKIAKKPFTHWIMMGLRNGGWYNISDENFTDSFDNPEERREAVKTEVVKRLKENGINGMYNLIRTKTNIDFGDGTYSYSDFLELPALTETKLRDLVVRKRKHYPKYINYATIVHLSIMVLMLSAAWVFVFRKRKGSEKLLVPYGAILGIWMFLMMWESQPRYFSNFAPVIFTLGVLGMDNFIQICCKIKGTIKLRLKE